MPYRQLLVALKSGPPIACREVYPVRVRGPGGLTVALRVVTGPDEPDTVVPLGQVVRVGPNALDVSPRPAAAAFADESSSYPGPDALRLAPENESAHPYLDPDPAEAAGVRLASELFGRDPRAG